MWALFTFRKGDQTKRVRICEAYLRLINLGKGHAWGILLVIMEDLVVLMA